MVYKQTSHLSMTSVVNGYATAYVPPIIPDYNNTTTFTLTQKYNKRPDLLSFDLYDTAALWWVFVLYNKNQLLDPINDFKTGVTILLPKRNSIAGL